MILKIRLEEILTERKWLIEKKGEKNFNYYHKQTYVCHKRRIGNF